MVHNERKSHKADVRAAAEVARDWDFLTKEKKKCFLVNLITNSFRAMYQTMDLTRNRLMALYLTLVYKLVVRIQGYGICHNRLYMLTFDPRVANPRSEAAAAHSP